MRAPRGGGGGGGVAGVAGLVGGVRRGAFGLGGGFAARRAAWVGWGGVLALGMRATLPMLVLALTYVAELGLTVLNSLFAGPSLLVPAALLFCLRWLVQQGAVAIPRTAKVERLSENIDVFDFMLSEEEMAAISALGRVDGRLTDYGFAPKWDCCRGVTLRTRICLMDPAGGIGQF